MVFWGNKALLGQGIVRCSHLGELASLYGLQKSCVLQTALFDGEYDLREIQRCESASRSGHSVSTILARAAVRNNMLLPSTKTLWTIAFVSISGDRFGGRVWQRRAALREEVDVIDGGG